jgi:hypothetical protein
MINKREYMKLDLNRPNNPSGNVTNAVITNAVIAWLRQLRA